MEFPGSPPAPQPIGSTSPISNASPAPLQPFRLQFGLIELIVLIVSVAVTLGVARRTVLANWQLTYNLYGLALIPVTIWLATRFITESLVVLRRTNGGRHLADGKAESRGLAVWRAVAVAALAGLTGAEIAALWMQYDFRQAAGGMMRYQASTRVVAVSGMILAIGLVIGSKQIRPGKRPVPRPSRSLQVFGWCVVALFALAATSQATMIHYLVLIAMEGVSMAARTWDGNGPGAVQRLSQGVVPIAWCVASCLLSGAWLSDDLRRRRWGVSPAFGSRRIVRVVLDVILFFSPIVSAVYVTVRFLPNVHSQFANGIMEAILPQDAAVVLVGFAGLSAGIAARAVAKRVVNEGEATYTLAAWGVKFPPLGIVVRAAIVFVSLATVTLSLLAVLAHPRIQLRPVAALFNPRVLAVTSPLLAMWSWIGRQLNMGGVALMSIGLVWLAVSAFQALCSPAVPGRSYFDSVMARVQILPFLWAWLRLTLLIVSALPTIFVAGIISYHYFLKLFG